MNALRLAFVLAALLTSAASAVTLDEASDGDFSNLRESPSAYVLAPGSNPMLGTTIAGDLDYVSVEVPAGATLDALTLVAYAGSDPIAFIAVQSGAVFTEPPTGTAVFRLLGYTHFGPGAGNVETDILDDLGLGPGAIGFDPPLPEGTYTFWIQQINSAPTDYHFDLFVVPEPQGPALLAAGCGALGVLDRRRRRRSARWHDR